MEEEERRGGEGGGGEVSTDNKPVLICSPIRAIKLNGSAKRESGGPSGLPSDPHCSSAPRRESTYSTTDIQSIVIFCMEIERWHQTGGGWRSFEESMSGVTVRLTEKQHF